MKIEKMQNVYLITVDDRFTFDIQIGQLAKFVNRGKGEQRWLEKCYTFTVSNGVLSVFTYNLYNSLREEIASCYPYNVDIESGIDLKFSVYYKDFERILKRLRGAFSIVVTSRGLFFEDGKEYFYCEDFSGYHSDRFETIYDQNKTGYAVNVETFKAAVAINSHILTTFRGEEILPNYTDQYTFLSCVDTMKVIEDIREIEDKSSVRCYITNNLLRALDLFFYDVVIYPTNEDSVKHIMQIDNSNNDSKTSFLLAGCDIGDEIYKPIRSVCNIEYERAHNDNG